MRRRLTGLILVAAVVWPGGCNWHRPRPPQLDLSGIPEAYLNSAMVPELDRDWLDGTGPYNPHARSQNHE